MQLTRRQLLVAAAWGITPIFLRAQGSYPGTIYRDYSRCLPDYLTGLAGQAYRERSRALDQVKTLESIRERQNWVRKTFWDLVGGMPERTPLNVQRTGSFDRSAYRVEKLTYESRPRMHIPANLYLPTLGEPPFPGVLFQMGHSLNGKANVSYQSCCQGLARLGFVVLAFDPMGQGERTYYPGPDGLTRLGSADDEHTLPGKQMLLFGDTSTRLQVWDAVRSLDVLASHPLVDSARLASTGQSGGGTLTMLLMAVDDRLAAAAVSSGNTENLACADFNPPGSTDDAEQNFINGPAVGFGRWDLLYPMAPRPLLILVSAKDFFGTYSPRYLSNGWEEYQRLQQVYEVMGKPEHLAWQDTPLPHGFAYNLRLQVYNWFRRWLQNQTDPVLEEPPVTPEKDNTLWVASSGSVVRSFQSETPFSLNLARSRKTPTPTTPRNLNRLLALEQPPAGVRFSVLGSVPSREIDVQALEIRAAERVWIPAWLFLPRKIDTDKTILLLVEPQGRNSRWREDQLYQQLARAGRIVCVPDLRGIGDLAPEFPRGAVRHGRWHQEEENYAWASLMLGRPLLGQRVTDLLTLIEGLSRHASCSNRPATLAAFGKMTVPALFAGALESRFQKLYLAQGLVSFRNLVKTPEYQHPFANFLPGMLLDTDLPQLAATLAPRDVYLAGTVNAAGKRISTSEVQTVYRSANIRLLAEPKWDFASLVRL